MQGNILTSFNWLESLQKKHLPQKEVFWIFMIFYNLIVSIVEFAKLMVKKTLKYHIYKEHCCIKSKQDPGYQSIFTSTYIQATVFVFLY